MRADSECSRVEYCPSLLDEALIFLLVLWKDDESRWDFPTAIVVGGEVSFVE
jgi:hypothetical protein